MQSGDQNCSFFFSTAAVGMWEFYQFFSVNRQMATPVTVLCILCVETVGLTAY